MKKKTSRCFTKTAWLPRISKTSIGKVTMKSRKDINTYESYSERCAKKIKREATTNSITKTESPSSLKSDVIDLCEVKEIDLLPGTPLKDIKTTNSLFYMYDPRGYFDNPLCGLSFAQNYWLCQQLKKSALSAKSAGEFFIVGI